MYDSTIHAKTILRQLRRSDFLADKMLFEQDHLNAVINEAVTIGQQGFPAVTLNASLLRGKPVYQVESIPQNLVLRHITSNIRRVTNVKQDDRAFIVRCLRDILSEGLPFRVYKFDIKSFYESVTVSDIVNKLGHDIAFSGQSIRTAQSFFAQLEQQGLKGLPRGIALSATLAEYLLRPFDRKVSELTGVWFFARFVDDIVIVTDGREIAQNFIAEMSTALPDGLVFNSKSKHFDFSRYTAPNADVTENELNFLVINLTLVRFIDDTTKNFFVRYFWILLIPK